MRAAISVVITAAAAACTGTHTAPEGGHHHGGGGAAPLGEVSFETTCSPQAHKTFNLGMLYQHSFWYRASRREFERAVALDPSCSIAYWGVAQSLLLNPFGPPPAQSLPEGLALLEKAETIATSPRERAYISALKTFYAGDGKRDHQSRLQAYLQASADLAKRYPDDDEAQIYHALALNMAASPSDKTYTLPLRAAAVLEPILQRKPRHPGVVHYLVHSYDFPPIASKGIEAAKRYAEIAGASPHALHMPSHIFTRVGYWNESIAANLRSAEVARADKEPDDELHAMDYLVYAYLQRAQDDNARAAVEAMSRVAGVNPGRHTGPFALAASRARYAIERDDWKGAAALPVEATRFPHVEAITHFARALGAARSGDPAAGAPAVAMLAGLRDKLRVHRQTYWAEQVGIAHDVARAWVLYGEGNSGAALSLLQAAADAEDRTDKHVVTPGPLAPARELYGSMLLLEGRAADALAAFEATLSKEPRRLKATLGAAKSAQRLGNRVRAREHFANALEIARGSEGARADLAEARRFLQ